MKKMLEPLKNPQQEEMEFFHIESKERIYESHKS